MERKYDEKRCYRVWLCIDGERSEAFFTDKKQADQYVDYLNHTHGKEVAFLNKWSWSMMIER